MIFAVREGRMMEFLFNVICFLAGMVCMILIGTCIDSRCSDYDRGYQDAIDDIFDELKEYEDET